MGDKLAEINERIERRRRENGEERRGIKEEVNTETNEDGVYRATIWLDDIEPEEEEEREVKFQLPEEFSLNAEAQERLEAVKINDTEDSNRPVEDNVDSFPEVQAVIKNEDDTFPVFEEEYGEVEIEEWEPEFEKKYTIIELSSDSEEEDQEESGSDKEEEKENEEDDKEDQVNKEEDEDEVDMEEEKDQVDTEDKENENNNDNEGVPQETCTWDCIHAHQNELLKTAQAELGNRITILEDMLQVKNGERYHQFLKTRQYLLDIGFGESDPVTNGKRSERSREVVELLQLIYTAEDEARSNADGKSSTVRSGPASVVVTVEEKGSQPTEACVEAPRKPKQRTAQTQTSSPSKDPSRTPTHRGSCSPHQSSEKASPSSLKDPSGTTTHRGSCSPFQSSQKASTSSQKDPSRTPTRKGSFSPRQSYEKASTSSQKEAQAQCKTKKPKQSTQISTNQRTPSPKPKKFPRFKKKAVSPTPKPTTPSTQYAVTSSILAPPTNSEKPTFNSKPTASSTSTTPRKRIPSSSSHEKTFPKQANALTTTPVKTSILTPSSAKANTPFLPSTPTLVAPSATAAPKWTLSADGKPIRGNKHSASASSSHPLHNLKRQKLAPNLLNLEPDEDEGSYATIEYKICPLCSEVIKQKNLRDHLINDHEQDHIKVKCPGANCGEEFQTRKLYRNHVTAKHAAPPGFDFSTFKKAEEPVLNWLKGLYKSAAKPSIAAVNEARLKQRKMRQNQITTVITTRSPPVRLKKDIPSSSQGKGTSSRSPLLPTPSPALISRPPPPIVPPFLQTQNIQIPFDPRIPPPPTPPRVPFQESSNPFDPRVPPPPTPPRAPLQESSNPNHNPFMQESIRPPKYSRFN